MSGVPMPGCRRCGVALAPDEYRLCGACWIATEADCDEMVTQDADEWRAIAAELAWSQSGEPHTEAERKALDRYDAAVFSEQFDLDDFDPSGSEPT